MNPFLHATRLALIGDDGFADLARVEDYVLRLHVDCTVLLGRPRGSVEQHAASLAAARGLRIELWAAAHRRLGRAAFGRRDRQLVDRAEYVVVFWDGLSRRGRAALDHATAVSRPSEVIVDLPPERAPPRVVLRMELVP